MTNNNKIAQDKLKLLYILKCINMPLINAELINYILEHNYMDYFTLHQLLNDLSSSNLIILNTQNGDDYYSISDSGEETLEMFTEKLPPYFIKEVNLSFPTLKKKIKREKELLSHYYKKDDDIYIVTLQVMENDSVIFNLSLNVPTEKSAKFVCKKWDDNPEDIFGNIIKILTN